jgi:hypothetical protein
MSEIKTSAPAPVAFDGEVRESVLSQIRYFESKGYDLNSLSVGELLEIQARFYSEWQGSDVRRTERDSAKAEREIKAKAAKEAREAERAKRLQDEKAKLEAKLAKLAGK